MLCTVTLARDLQKYIAKKIRLALSFLQKNGLQTTLSNPLIYIRKGVKTINPRNRSKLHD